MKKQAFQLILFAALFFGWEQPASARGITVGSTVPVRLSDTQDGVFVSYTYDFPGRSRVNITGIGDVPAKGTFRYLTLDRTLSIRDKAGGTVLETADLSPTIALAAKPPLNEIPSRSDFDSGFRSFRWPSTDSLTMKANSVLGRYFVYEPRQVDGVTELATTFAVVPFPPGKKQRVGRIAIVLSYPYESGPKGYSVRIRMTKFLVRRQRYWDDSVRKIAEGLASVWVDIKPQFSGVASGGVRGSSV